MPSNHNHVKVQISRHLLFKVETRETISDSAVSAMYSYDANQNTVHI